MFHKFYLPTVAYADSPGAETTVVEAPVAFDTTLLTAVSAPAWSAAVPSCPMGKDEWNSFPANPGALNPSKPPKLNGIINGSWCS
jgi:hypothetical protein